MYSYQSLPRRVVVASPFSKKEVVSCGIICKCLQTERYIMVQARFTSACKYLILGLYRPVHFEKLLQYCSKQEVFRFQEFVRLNNYCGFMEFAKRIIPNRYNLDYSFQRLIDLKEELMDFDTKNNIPEPVFTFPRGGIKPQESRMDAALREFKEETGITCPGGVEDPPIHHYEEGLAGRNYHMQCWKTSVEEEIELSEDQKNNEIAKCAWVTIPKDNTGKYVQIEIGRNKKKGYITRQTYELLL